MSFFTKYVLWIQRVEACVVFDYMFYQDRSVRIFSTKGENPNEGGFLVLEHDGGEDGDGEGDHGKVAADLLVVPHLQ